MTRGEIPEGTFTGAGLDLLASRAASEHVALQWEPEPPRSWWQRVLEFLGLSE